MFSLKTGRTTGCVRGGATSAVEGGRILDTGPLKDLESTERAPLIADGRLLTISLEDCNPLTCIRVFDADCFQLRLRNRRSAALNGESDIAASLPKDHAEE